MSGTQQIGADFLRSLRRRQAAMAAGGFLTFLAGIMLTSIAGGFAVWCVGLAIVGILLLGGAAVQYRLLRDARRLPGTAPQRMQLFTWPYRSFRSPVNDRLLVTLDLPGSVERTPLAEFTALWSTGRTAAPARQETPGRPAEVFGELRRGQPVLAVGEDGSCFLGRISRTPRSGPAAQQP